MFGKTEKSKPGLNRDSKPIWQQDARERKATAAQRLNTLREHFQSKGCEVGTDDQAIVIGTPKNNYFLDIAEYDPRLIKMEVVYIVVPGDIEMASWACYNATASIYGAKAKAIPEKDGFRLRFTSEIFADELTAFTDVAALHMAAIEDCREAYLAMMRQAIEAGGISWSTQPEPKGERPPKPAAAIDEKQIQLLCASFGQIVMPQIARLDLQLGEVSPSSLAGSVEACAYIGGLCNHLVNLSGYQPHDEYGVLLGSWAFNEIYGKIGHQLHMKTLEAIASGSPSVVFGVRRAHADLVAVTEKQTAIEPSGFWEIASGAAFRQR
jgi:hypothetical protein